MFLFKVEKGFVKYKGKVYYQGDFLPTNFTERDRARQVYSRRLVRVEIHDESFNIQSAANFVEPQKEKISTEVSAEEVQEALSNKEIKAEENLPSAIKKPGTQLGLKKTPINKK